MKIILVPLWMEKTLKEHQLYIGDILHPEKLIDILSKDDLAFYIYLNSNLSKIFPEEVCQTFLTGLPALNFDQDTLVALDSLILEQAVRHNKTGVIPMYELLDVLAEDDVQFEQIDFLTCCTEEDTVIITVSQHPETQQEHWLELIDNLLTHLYRSMALPKLVKTPLFRYFLKLT